MELLTTTSVLLGNRAWATKWPKLDMTEHGFKKITKIILVMRRQASTTGKKPVLSLGMYDTLKESNSTRKFVV